MERKIMISTNLLGFLSNPFNVKIKKCEIKKTAWRKSCQRRRVLPSAQHASPPTVLIFIVFTRYVRLENEDLMIMWPSCNDSLTMKTSTLGNTLISSPVRELLKKNYINSLYWRISSRSNLVNVYVKKNGCNLIILNIKKSHWMEKIAAKS